MATTRTTKTTKAKAAKPAVAAADTEKKVPASVEAPIFSMAGEKVGSIALPAKIFGAPWRADLVHQVVTAQQANARQNRAHTKDRSEVSGSNIKPWKQKGTGQARAGQKRSPIWRHGGITFGPRNTRDYHEKINRKMRLQALLSILSRKAADGEIILIDKLNFAAPKTSVAKSALVALSKTEGAGGLITKKKNAALFLMGTYDESTIKSFKNIGSVGTEELRNVNPVDLVTYKYLVIESPEEAFKALEKRIK